MNYRANDLHLSEMGVSRWQIQQSSNNSSLYHQLKSEAKNIKRWKQIRSIDMKKDYQKSQSRNIRSQNCMDKFDQIAYEEMLKNKARQFIIKIRKQKQKYYGKLISIKMNQQKSKIVQNQQGVNKQGYQKSIRQQRTRVIEHKRIKRLSQLKLKNQKLNDTQPILQQDFQKSSSALYQSKNQHIKKQHKYKGLQTIPEDKDKSHRVLSINRLNKDKQIKTEPSKEHHYQIDHSLQKKSLSPKKVLPSSSSNNYFQSKIRLPQSKLLLTTKDRQQLEEINNKMTILIRLNRKK